MERKVHSEIINVKRAQPVPSEYIILLSGSMSYHHIHFHNILFERNIVPERDGNGDNGG